jgi:capsular polysaccharide biosynthesis protein
MNVPQRDQMAFPSLGSIAEVGGVSPRSHNEAVLAGVAWILWRKRWWIATATVAAICLGTLYLLIMPKEYLGEAVVRLDFEVNQAGTGSRAALDAGSLVESEARIFRSRRLAEKVVRTLSLTDDPAFAGERGLIRRMFSALSSPAGDNAPSDPGDGEPRTQEGPRGAVTRATNTVVANTTIESGSKSYVIAVRYRWHSPEMAAKIANAVVHEYFRERQYQDLLALIARLQGESGQLSEQLGEKHPTWRATQRRLDNAQRRLKEDHQSGDRAQLASIRSVRLQNLSADLIIPAVPPVSPASPRPIIVYLLSVVLGIASSCVALLLYARRSKGLANETEAEKVLGMRCFGVVPAPPKDNSQKEWAVLFEAVGIVGVEAGLDAAGPSCKVAVITSSLPDEEKTLFTTSLAIVAAESGRNVLVLNGVPQSVSGCDTTLVCDESTSVAPTTPEGVPSHPRISFGTLYPTFSNQETERYIRSARESYNLILIKGPPVLLAADAARLARLSDTVILVVKWRKTPQDAVARAARLLRDAGVHIKGAVLTGVDLREQRLEWVRDRSYYLSKYQEFFLSLRRWSRTSHNSEHL